MSLNIKRFVIHTRAVDNYQFNSILPTATELTSDCFSDWLSNQPLTLREGPTADTLFLPPPLTLLRTCAPQKVCLDPFSGCPKPETQARLREEAGGSPAAMDVSSAAKLLGCKPGRCRRQLVARSCPSSPHPAWPSTAGAGAELLGLCRRGRCGGHRESCTQPVSLSGQLWFRVMVWLGELIFKLSAFC